MVLTVIPNPRLCKTCSHVRLQLVHEDMLTAQRTFYPCVNWEEGRGGEGRGGEGRGGVDRRYTQRLLV